MLTKQAVEKALEGGWMTFKGPVEVEIYGNGRVNFNSGGVITGINESGVVLDPKFWQALGKALGWDDGEIERVGYADGRYPWMWQFIAHQFYDLILTGGDTNKFWEELLK